MLPVAWFAFHLARLEGVCFGFECLRPITQGQRQLRFNEVNFEGLVSKMVDARKVNSASFNIRDFDAVCAIRFSFGQGSNAKSDGWSEAQDMLAALDCLFENAVLNLPTRRPDW